VSNKIKPREKLSGGNKKEIKKLAEKPVKA
jgi:hypothetical protein